ncbi:unnamed protein product [Phytomonas sp. Hart1]|nr:unnamed protein product [Phytomonas sp. Hart1]|eukprot:CCW70463.1 unnamed protein product [Phytomonas sp. isolate Hart1]
MEPRSVNQRHTRGFKRPFNVSSSEGDSSPFSRFHNGRGRGGSAGRCPPFSKRGRLDEYRPQVAEETIPHNTSQETPVNRLKGRNTRPVRNNTHKKGQDVVVILEKAGLLLGNVGLVDAYERAATTEITNASLREVRPDIVHQCLLALCDSNLAHEHRLRIYISMFSCNGKVIEVSPALRPPRTYARFRGLMAALLRDGRVTSTNDEVLMRVMPGSIAPIIPHGADVIGVCNGLTAPVVTASRLAEEAITNPVDDALQGGVKNVASFFCIPCTDDCSLDGIDYVTRTVCLSAYPTTSHVMCARICEGFMRMWSRSKGGECTVENS